MSTAASQCTLGQTSRCLRITRDDFQFATSFIIIHCMGSEVTKPINGTSSLDRRRRLHLLREADNFPSQITHKSLNKWCCLSSPSSLRAHILPAARRVLSRPQYIFPQHLQSRSLTLWSPSPTLPYRPTLLARRTNPPRSANRTCPPRLLRRHQLQHRPCPARTQHNHPHQA